MEHISNCPDQDAVKDDMKDNIWCSLASRNVKSNCTFYSGEICLCIECSGSSILTKVKKIILSLIYSTHDTLMKKIRKEVVENEVDMDMDGDDAISSVLEKHRSEIMNKYDAAKHSLESCGWNEDLRQTENHPWTFMDTCRHINVSDDDD